MNDEKKKNLRKKMIGLRKALDKKSVNSKSVQILDRLKNIVDFTKISNILVYSSFNNEVETRGIIEEIRQLGGKVFLPVLVSDEEFIACEMSDSWVKNKYGIDEPKLESIQEKIDIIICPGVAFDINLNRLGFGGGFYDRYLKGKTDALKIGLAFDFQIVDNVYPSNHDVAMDIIISEKRIIKNDENN